MPIAAQLTVIFCRSNKTWHQLAHPDTNVLKISAMVDALRLIHPTELPKYQRSSLVFFCQYRLCILIYRHTALFPFPFSLFPFPFLLSPICAAARGVMV